MLSTATVDTLLWTAIGFFVIRLLRTGDGRWWVAIGAAIGLALTNKWLVLLLVLTLGASLVAVGPAGCCGRGGLWRESRWPAVYRHRS
jgi:hypothetical protein